MAVRVPVFAALGCALLVLSLATLTARQDKVMRSGLRLLAVLGCAAVAWLPPFPLTDTMPKSTPQTGT